MNPPREEKEPDPRAAERSAPILVVDDDAELRRILGERLASEGFDTANASSGEEALLLYLAAAQVGLPFGSLLLDVRMGILGGLEVLRLVRKRDHRTPILVISGFGDLAAAVRSLREGADDYISKPIKVWDLRDRVTTAAARRRALGERAGAAAGRGLGWGESLGPSEEAGATRPKAKEMEKPRERRPPATGETPGSKPASAGAEPAAEAGAAPATLLDALFELSAAVEEDHAGFAGHGERVLGWVTKLGAQVARGLGIEATGLEALRAAARLHALGLVRDQGASLLLHPPAEAGSVEERLAPGQNAEGPRAAQALLEARRAVAGACASLGASWGVQPEALDRAASLLGEVARRRAELVASGEVLPAAGKLAAPDLGLLVELFEIADAWVHLRGPENGGARARRAFARVGAQFEAGASTDRPRLLAALGQLAGLATSEG